jgi:1-acyl-sn-glycerol-3-phosphate acyltransferase
VNNPFLVVRNTIKKLNQDIQEDGLQPAMYNLARNFGTDVNVHNKDIHLDTILKNNPVIVAANHPAEADVIALLASLTHRKDIYLVINSCFLHISPSLDKHLIPVYITHHLIRKNNPNIRFRLFKLIHKFPSYSEEEEHNKNINSIELASKKLKKGALIVVFPGGGGEEGKWFSGIGHILKEARGTKDLCFVKAFIRGTSDKDYLRLLPIISRFLPPFKVVFSGAKILEDVDLREAKAITLELENEYNSWVKTITN